MQLDAIVSARPACCSSVGGFRLRSEWDVASPSSFPAKPQDLHTRQRAASAGSCELSNETASEPSICLYPGRCSSSSTADGPKPSSSLARSCQRLDPIACGQHTKRTERSEEANFLVAALSSSFAGERQFQRFSPTSRVQYCTYPDSGAVYNGVEGSRSLSRATPLRPV